jgi:hypothetical protein
MIPAMTRIPVKIKRKKYFRLIHIALNEFTKKQQFFQDELLILHKIIWINGKD